jgi:site-specific recombinase XerD
LRKFLVFAVGGAGSSLQDLQPKDVSKFIETRRHMKPRTLAGLISALRLFLHYLWVHEIVSQDLGLSLPKIRIPEDAHIPTVWSKDQIDAILSTVDRTSRRGKRDFAILILACRLGIRSKDIRELKLENLDWVQSRIEISQSKTGTSLVLPLLDDVGNAIIDYLQNGRPNSSCREVFLRNRPPIGPIASSSALSSVMNSYRERAGIEVPRNGHGSMHSLRHTLATELLKQATPLGTISNVLGHASMESARIYTKVDVPALRSAALNPDAMIFEEVCYG